MTHMINRYALGAASAGFALAPVPVAQRAPGPTEVVVAMSAVSLNYRDLLVVDGHYPGINVGLSPMSDGAGVVVEVGSAVTRWQVGDHVAPIFMPQWIDGRFKRDYLATARGGEGDGVMADRLTLDEAGLVRIPDELDFAEAATLPCAGVTAWQALMGRQPIGAEDTVLIQGTGGVALFGLQIAKAVGARVIILSSSDDKLARAQALGADAGINYRREEAWDAAVMKTTDGRGVDHVLELGGPATYQKSIGTLAAGGVISQIGVLTGFGPQPSLGPIQSLNATIQGITVGSRRHFEDLNAFVTNHGIRPVIGARLAVGDVVQAFGMMREATHFGKIVVDL
jgi:NADPH:quinone reductase-like Zn-dependent oxidoreductase